MEYFKMADHGGRFEDLPSDVTRSRAVRFQKFHLGSGFGFLVVKKPRFGPGFGSF